MVHGLTPGIAAILADAVAERDEWEDRYNDGQPAWWLDGHCQECTQGSTPHHLERRCWYHSAKAMLATDAKQQG